MLWLGIFSMIMVFGALTSAYLVRKGQSNWGEFLLPPMFYVSTGIILLSSVTMNWALSSVKSGNNKNLTLAVWITLLLGIGFAVCQFLGWGQLVDDQIFFVDKERASGSYLYLLTGLHLAHLAGGLIALLVVGSKAAANKYSSDNYLGVKLCSMYWHFLDGLWIYLFLFLLIIH